MGGKGSGSNPKSRKNLKPPIKKGEVRNPKGINRKRPLTDEYFADLQSPMPAKICYRLGLPTGSTFAMGHARQRNIDGTKAGGHPSSKEMREAIEGKAPMRIEMTGTQEKRITIRVLHDRKRV